MCFTIPKQIIEVRGSQAILEGGEKADIGAVESCATGDYLIVTDGIAIQKIARDQAQSMRSLIKQTHDELA